MEFHKHLKSRKQNENLWNDIIKLSNEIIFLHENDNSNPEKIEIFKTNHIELLKEHYNWEVILKE